MVLYVRSSNNFNNDKPIKTNQNVEHIIRKAEQLGGPLVYRLTNTWYLVFMRSSILHAWYHIKIRALLYTRITIIPTWYTSPAPVNALQPSHTQGCSGSQGGWGSDSLSSISESSEEGSGLSADTPGTYSGKYGIPGA